MKLSQRNEDLLFKIALFGAGYLLFAKPILDALGITKSGTDKNIDYQSSSPDSPFNSNFWQRYMYYQDSMQPKGRKLVTSSIVERINTAIKGLVNGFGYFSDNEDEIIGAVKLMRSKAEISLLSWYLYIKFKRDLLRYLQEGRGVLPQNGLSDNDMKIVLNYVNKLPNV